jgi:glycosyltransferase involved in cell wall biosynthesis
MHILISGGIFRLTVEERAKRQPSPEILLVEGLIDRGVKVDFCPLEDYHKAIFASKYDLVHVHHLSKFAVLAAVSPLSRPMIFTEHGMPTQLDNLQKLARRLVNKKSDAVICLSQAERISKIQNLGLDSKKIEVIPNSVANQQWYPIKRLLNGEAFRLLFVGQLIQIKQVERICFAMTEMTLNVELQIVYHNNEQLRKLKDLVVSLNLTERVSFHSNLNGKRLHEMYLMSHVLVLPSLHEASPSVISEALMTGLPIIASNVGGIPEQVGLGGILVSPHRNDSIAPALQDMYFQYSNFAQLAFDQGHKLIKKLDFTKFIDRHLKLYYKLLE